MASSEISLNNNNNNKCNINIKFSNVTVIVDRFQEYQIFVN